MPADEGRSWPKSSPSDAVMDNSSQLSAKICLFPLLPVDKKNAAGFRESWNH